MNTTTITINWKDYEGFKQAINTISTSVLNTFEKETDEFYIEVSSAPIKFSRERLIEAMNRLECNSRTRHRKLAMRRYFIWRYCYSKFEIGVVELGRITNHHHASVLHGLKATKDKAIYEDVREMKREVYAICDQIFI